MALNLRDEARNWTFGMLRPYDDFHYKHDGLLDLIYHAQQLGREDEVHILRTTYLIQTGISLFPRSISFQNLLKQEYRGDAIEAIDVSAKNT
jgi:hypothetical protein